ncbi:hypothetical protein SO802_004812 [Lithocarpus litseifolius]|uniref:Uncharacterized protein n=1 Tax=Lithocarpus litseifolius TaxID=425828 RepID=A0AAW2DHM1_9ROSI
MSGSGGAVTCASLHLGEIRPGALRGNHRHHTCNETLFIWGAKTKYSLENSQVVSKGYAEVIIDADEVAVAASPSGTAHALVNGIGNGNGIGVARGPDLGHYIHKAKSFFVIPNKIELVQVKNWDKSSEKPPPA